jgi:hypothetical protein
VLESPYSTIHPKKKKLCAMATDTASSRPAARPPAAGGPAREEPAALKPFNDRLGECDKKIAELKTKLVRLPLLFLGRRGQGEPTQRWAASPCRDETVLHPRASQVQTSPEDLARRRGCVGGSLRLACGGCEPGATDPFAPRHPRRGRPRQHIRPTARTTRRTRPRFSSRR